MGGRGRGAAHMERMRAQRAPVHQCSGRPGEAPGPLGVLDVQGRAVDDESIAEGRNLIFVGPRQLLPNDGK